MKLGKLQGNHTDTINKFRDKKKFLGHTKTVTT